MKSKNSKPLRQRYQSNKTAKFQRTQTELFLNLLDKKYNKKGKKLLDIGAGQAPYKKYFKKLDYFTQDIKQDKNKTIDYIGDINQSLKMIDKDSFDYILCTQTLEHLKEPQSALQEFYRILKPGGRVFLTTNFIYQIHMAPNDYYRFTKFGLKHLGKSNGFIVEHLKPHGGIFQVLSYVVITLPIRLFLKRNIFFYYLYLALFAIPIILFNLAALALDIFDTDKEMTINYEVIYKKPANLGRDYIKS